MYSMHFCAFLCHVLPLCWAVFWGDLSGSDHAILGFETLLQCCGVSPPGRLRRVGSGDLFQPKRRPDYQLRLLLGVPSQTEIPRPGSQHVFANILLQTFSSLPGAQPHLCQPPWVGRNQSSLPTYSKDWLFIEQFGARQPSCTWCGTARAELSGIWVEQWCNCLRSVAIWDLNGSEVFEALKVFCFRKSLRCW